MYHWLGGETSRKPGLTWWVCESLIRGETSRKSGLAQCVCESLIRGETSRKSGLAQCLLFTEHLNQPWKTEHATDNESSWGQCLKIKQTTDDESS